MVDVAQRQRLRILCFRLGRGLERGLQRGFKRRLDRALRAIRIDAVHLLLRDGRIDQLRVGGQHVAGLAGAVQRGLEPDAAVRIPLVAVEHEQLVSGHGLHLAGAGLLARAGQQRDQ